MCFVCSGSCPHESSLALEEPYAAILEIWRHHTDCAIVQHSSPFVANPQRAERDPSDLDSSPNQPLPAPVCNCFLLPTTDSHLSGFGSVSVATLDPRQRFRRLARGQSIIPSSLLDKLRLTRQLCLVDPSGLTESS